MSQTDMILKHLLDFGNITTWEAFKEYGITRLSDKIYQLRKKGYEISNYQMSSINRYGKKINFVKYML